MSRFAYLKKLSCILPFFSPLFLFPSTKVQKVRVGIVSSVPQTQSPCERSSVYGVEALYIQRTLPWPTHGLCTFLFFNGSLRCFDLLFPWLLGSMWLCFVIVPSGFTEHSFNMGSRVFPCCPGLFRPLILWNRLQFDLIFACTPVPSRPTVSD